MTRTLAQRSMSCSALIELYHAHTAAVLALLRQSLPRYVEPRLLLGSAMPLPNSVGDIGQIAITVSNVARAKQFYVDVLGLRPLFDAGPNLSFVAAGPVRVMLSTAQGHGEPGKNSTLYFKVSAAHSAFEACVARGATPERAAELAAKMPDHELWLAFLRDPDGNLVGLMEERR